MPDGNRIANKIYRAVIYCLLISGLVFSLLYLHDKYSKMADKNNCGSADNFATGSLFKYMDKKGVLHFVPDYESVPEEYREDVETIRMGNDDLEKGEVLIDSNQFQTEKPPIIPLSKEFQKQSGSVNQNISSQKQRIKSLKGRNKNHKEERFGPIKVKR